MSDDDITLGAFRLREQLGRGPSNETWRAKHLRYDVDAVVKLASGLAGQQSPTIRRHRDTAAALANLQHRGLPLVLDYGETDLTLPGGNEGERPYVIRKWVPGRTLTDVVPLTQWRDIREYLLGILDALAHAHAGALLHLNLKPENVVLGEDGTVRLVDFGFGHDPEQSVTDGHAVRFGGAPRWMAPELLRGAQREQGPWTDLYSLGCLVFWLLTYRPPYSPGDVEEMIRGHLEEPIPRLRSRVPVPSDFESWLRRLLAKDPNDRYRFAADAARDLAQFPVEIYNPVDASDLPDPHAVDTRPGDSMEAELFGEEPVGLDEPSSYAVFETSAMPVRLSPQPAPPRSWVRSEPIETSADLMGVGLDLWTTRPVPLLDRDGERDELWRILRQTHEEGGSRVVVLRGARGVGKTRLAQWLCHRAHELGAAHVGSARHSRWSNPLEGIGAMATRHFRASGLDAAQSLGRIRSEFTALQHSDQHADALTLTELLERSNSPGQVNATDSRVRWWGALSRYFESLTSDRPLVLWLDDAQWGAESLDFVDYLQSDASARPSVLVVLTVDEDSLDDRPLERVLLSQIVERAGTDTYVVEPLRPSYRAELIERVLRLDSSLATTVLDRMEGHPLYAIQLVCDWIQAGAIELGDDATFHPASGVELASPDELQSVWERRLGRLLEGVEHPEECRRALEIAAILGEDVHPVEWNAIANVTAVSIEDGLVDRLVRAGLAVFREDGWAFCHSTFRDVLEEGAASRGRLARWHAACADFLRDIYGSDGETAERHALHLIAANRPEEALDSLLRAARVEATRGAFDRVEAIFRVYDDTIASLYDGPSGRKALGLIHRVHTAPFDDDSGQITDWLDEAERLLGHLDRDDELRAELLFARAVERQIAGLPGEAIAMAEESLEIFEQRKQSGRIAAVRQTLGELYRAQADFEASTKCHTEARRIFDDLRDDYRVGWCELGLAITAGRMDNLHRYATHVEAAIAAFEQAGNHAALGRSYRHKGDGLRLQEQYDHALEAYDRAIEYLPTHDPELAKAEFALGLTHLALEDWSLAREWLRKARRSFQNRDSPDRHEPEVELAMLVCAAGERRWHELESLTDSALRKLADSKGESADETTAWLLTRAGRYTEKAGEFRRAAEFWELARQQWTRLGREDRAEAVARAIQSL